MASQQTDQQQVPSVGNLIRQLERVDALPLPMEKRSVFVAAVQLTIDGLAYQLFGPDEPTS